MTHSLTIGLLWHDATSANLGVSALTHAQIKILRDAAHDAEVALTLVEIGWCADSQHPQRSEISCSCQVNGKRLVGIDPKLNRCLEECDLILDIGEGDSFSDIYGWKRLSYLLGTKFLAYRHKRPLVMSPQTIGPFRNTFAAWLADKAMNRATVICSRDILSTSYLRTRKLSSHTLESVDVAFALPFEPPATASTKPRIGINVSGLLWSGGYSQNNQFGLKLDYRATIRELLARFAQLSGVDIVLVPHVVTQYQTTEDDLRTSELLAQEFGGISVAGPFDSPMAAKSYIATCDFFVGARMHACIAAFSSNVACIPMAYSRKFSGLFASLGYSHIADCTIETQSTVIQNILNGYENRRKLQELVRAGNLIANQRLQQYRSFLAQHIRQIVRKSTARLPTSMCD